MPKTQIAKEIELQQQVDRELISSIFDKITELRNEFPELEGMRVPDIAFKAVQAFSRELRAKETRQQHFERVASRNGDCDE